METLQSSKPSGSDLLKEFEQKSPFLCLANKLDIPPVWCLLDDHKHLFLEDHEHLDKKMLFDIVEAEELVVCVDEIGGRPWGLFYISDIDTAARHGVIHFLCEPKRLRDVLRHDLIGQFIDKAFVVYNIDKIKGRAISTQSTAIKLLVMNRFYKVGTQLNEVVIQKKRANVILFELQKHYWQKMRRDTDGTGRPANGRYEDWRFRAATANDGRRRRGRNRGSANRDWVASTNEGHAVSAATASPSVVQRGAPMDAGDAIPTA